MNFTKLQGFLRLELQRRMGRGTLSVSLLARQTGLGQSHISNFLHEQRGMSLGALDRIMQALHVEVTDLMPAGRDELSSGQTGAVTLVPLVSHAVAVHEPYIRYSSVQRMVPFPAEEVAGLRERCTAARRQWERFVTVQLSAADVVGMEPELRAHALVLLDRHYNSLVVYREGEPNLYAVRSGGRLVVRYADFEAERLVLRARDVGIGVEVIELEAGETVHDLLVGRVGLILMER